MSTEPKPTHKIIQKHCRRGSRAILQLSVALHALLTSRIVLHFLTVPTSTDVQTSSVLYAPGTSINHTSSIIWFPGCNWTVNLMGWPNNCVQVKTTVHRSVRTCFSGDISNNASLKLAKIDNWPTSFDSTKKLIETSFKETSLFIIFFYCIRYTVVVDQQK